MKGLFWLTFEYEEKKTVSRIVLKKLDFVELSIQAKYLRVWILHDD